MPRKLVYVEWVDAVGPADSGWMDDEQLLEMLGREMLIQDCGFVIDDNKEYLSLVAGLSEEPKDSEWNNHYHRLIRIPKACIRKRKDLSRFIT